MMHRALTAAHPALADLRAWLGEIDGSGSRQPGALPFGLPALDRRLPQGGLARGALREVAGGIHGAVDGAAAACFVAGIAARQGQVLWCVGRTTLLAPGLAQMGLPPERVPMIRARGRAASR